MGTYNSAPIVAWFSFRNRLDACIRAIELTTSDQGVYTNAAVQLGKLMDSAAFKVWSTVLTILLVIIWLSNAALTAKGALSGKLLGLNS